MPLKLLRCVVLLSVFAKHLPMYKIFDLCIYLRSEASWIIAVLFGIHGNVLLLTKWNELKQNLLSSYVTNPKYSTPMKIILHFAIILDYRPFNIVGKLQI